MPSQWLQRVPSDSDGDDAGELLYPVEERVALLDGGLVERVLAVRPVAAHHALHLVHLAAAHPHRTTVSTKEGSYLDVCITQL